MQFENGVLFKCFRFPGNTKKVDKIRLKIRVTHSNLALISKLCHHGNGLFVLTRFISRDSDVPHGGFRDTEAQPENNVNELKPRVEAGLDPRPGISSPMLKPLGYRLFLLK